MCCRVLALLGVLSTGAMLAAEPREPALTERDRATSETAPRRPWPFKGLLGRREVATQE